MHMRPVAAMRTRQMVQSAFARAIQRLLLLMVVALGFARTLPAQQISSHTLVYAVYQGEATAGDVLASMRVAQHATGEQIESYAVVSRNPEGKITVHERPTRDAARSAAIDLMLGTLGKPADGPAVGTNGIGSDVVDRLRASLMPGSSAVIAVLNDRWVPKSQRELESARARALMLTRITQGSVGVVRITGSAMAAGSTGRPATAPSARPNPPASSP